MRVDKAINLVAICRVCHTAAHYEGRPGYDDLIALVAKREGRTVDDIEREIAADRRRTRK